MNTIFITGASAGLGKATAELFQAKGWRVIATMRDPAKGHALARLPNVVLLPLDVTDAGSIAAAVREATATHPVDVVFNNAGYGLGGPLEHTTEAQVLEQIDTNLTGVIRVTKAFIPYFKERRKGLFITTTSIFGFSSCPQSSVYNATKWALEGFCESLSYDLAVFNIGIKTVASGGIRSNFVNAMHMATGAEYTALGERMGAMIANGQLFRFNTVESIAAVVFDAATDGKDQLRYLGGEDAVRTAQERSAKGTEQYRRDLRAALGLQAPTSTI